MKVSEEEIKKDKKDKKYKEYDPIESSIEFKKFSDKTNKILGQPSKGNPLVKYLSKVHSVYDRSKEFPNNPEIVRIGCATLATATEYTASVVMISAARTVTVGVTAGVTAVTSNPAMGYSAGVVTAASLVKPIEYASKNVGDLTNQGCSVSYNYLKDNYPAIKQNVSERANSISNSTIDAGKTAISNLKTINAVSKGAMNVISSHLNTTTPTWPSPNHAAERLNSLKNSAVEVGKTAVSNFNSNWKRLSPFLALSPAKVVYSAALCAANYYSRNPSANKNGLNSSSNLVNKSTNLSNLSVNNASYSIFNNVLKSYGNVQSLLYSSYINGRTGTNSFNLNTSQGVYQFFNSISRQNSSNGNQQNGPKDSCVFIKESSKLGYPGNYSYNAFAAVLGATGLCNSYNGIHGEAGVNSSEGGSSDIGGVAAQVGIIEGMQNSPEQILDNEHILCFPVRNAGQLFTNDELKQLANELYNGIFNHDAYPFFSLHFNNEGILYPVLHPAYEDTLVGEVIAILDYLMKGYLNGGIFDNELLKKWHEIPNTDRNYLKSKLIDIKKLCKENFSNIGYVSLRELMCKYGLELPADQRAVDPNNPNSIYNTKFRTSFRIIAGQEAIYKDGNILQFKPKINVEYTIDITPEYKEHLERYRQDHGSDPADYTSLVALYEQVAQDIKEKMPQLPFCKDYFDMLGVINSLCYYFTTLKQRGQAPDLPSDYQQRVAVTPKAFPPIPVRYFETYNVNITTKDVLDKLLEKEAKEPNNSSNFNNYLLSIFEGEESEFPPQLKDRITNIIRTLVLTQIATKTKTQVQEISDEFTNIILRNLRQIFTSFSQLGHSTFYSLVNTHNQTFASYEIDIEQLDSYPKLDEKVVFIEKNLDQIQQKIHESYKTLISHAPDDIIARIINIGQQDIQQIRNNSEKHIRDEVAKIPPHLVNINQTNINNFTTNERTRCNNEIENYTKFKARQWCSEIVTLIQDFETKSEFKGIKIENSTPQRQGLLAAINNGTDPISRWNKQSKEQLQQIKLAMKELSKVLLLEEDLISDPLTKYYNHSVIGIADSSYYQEVGDNFRIVGGCGMKLKNIPATNMPKAEQFAQELHKAIKNQPYASLVNIKIEDKDYAIFKLGCKEKSVSSPLEYAEIINTETFMGEEETQAIEDLFNQAANNDPVKLGSFNSKKLDPAGQNILHYVATFAKEQALDVVLKVDKELLIQTDKKGNLPIHAACISGNIEAITYFHKLNPALIEAKNRNAITPLILAVLNGQTAAVEKLIALGANPNHLLPNGLFSLYISIQNADTDTAICLLKKANGINVNLAIDSGNTSLHLAIEQGLITIAAELISKGADLNLRRKSDDYTPFHLAASKGHADLVRSILATGKVQVDSLLSSSKTALYIAASNGHLDVVKVLVEQYKANVDFITRDKQTPLMAALSAGHKDVAIYLAGISKVNSVNRNAESASVIAAKNKQFEVADILINRGESIQLKDASNLSYDYYLLQHGEYHRYRHLVEREKVDVKSLFGQESSLAVAATFGHNLLVDYLLAKNVKYQTSNEARLIELSVKSDNIAYLKEWSKDSKHIGNKKKIKKLAIIAAENGSSNCLKILLKLLGQPELEQQATINSLLQASIKSHKMAIIDIVLYHCKDSNAALDEQKNNLGHFVALLGEVNLIEPLYKAGVSFNDYNSKGQTAFHVAIEHDDSKLLKRLLKIVDSNNWPQDLLAFAIDQQKPSCKEVLIKNRFNPSYKIEPKQVAVLMTAIEAQDYEQIENLLKKGLSPNLVSEKTYPLHLAIIKGNLSIVALLLKYKADPALKTKDLDAFATAIKHDQIEIIKLFHQLGYGKVMQANKDYYLKITKNQFTQEAISNSYTKLETAKTNLTKALDKRNLRNVRAILKDFPINSVSINYYGDNKPLLLHLLNLHYLFDKKFIESVLYIIEGKADPFVKDDNGDGLVSTLVAVEMDAVKQKLKWLESHFPDAKDKILTQKTSVGLNILEIASKVGKKSLVMLLLENGFPINESGNDDTTLLHKLAAIGDVEALNFIIKQGHSVNIKNKKNITPLMIAAAAGNLRFVETLLKAGANIEEKDIYQDTALNYAIKSNQSEIACYLLGISQNINERNRDSFTPFMLAAARGLLPVTKTLSASMTRFDKTSKKGFNALHLAASKGHVEMVKFLLSLGMDINSPVIQPNKSFNGATALHLAAFAGNIKLFIYLVQNGANLSKKDQFGKTPAEYAIISKNKDMAQIILKQLPEFHLTNQSNQLVISAARSNNTDILRELIIKGFDINTVDTLGRSALHYAALNNANNAVALLLEQGVYPNTIDFEANTALHLAIHSGNVDIIKQLIDSGIEPNYQNKDGETALYLASKKGDYASVLQLIRHGADHITGNKDAVTPGQIALINGHKKIVSLFFVLGDTSIAPASVALLPVHSQMKLKQFVPYLQELLNMSLEAIKLGQGPLHLAVLTGQNDALKLLASYFQDYINIPDINGITPLDLAKSMQSHDSVRILETILEAKIQELEPQETDSTSEEENQVQIKDTHSIDDNLAKIIINNLAGNGVEVASKLATIFGSLPQEASLLFLNGMDHVLEKDKLDYANKWHNFLAKLQNNSGFLTRFANSFLSHYPGHVLLNNKFVALIEMLSKAESPKLIEWFFKYFEPITIIKLTTEQLETVTKQFQEFANEIINSKLQDKLAPPPQKAISFHINDGNNSYIQRAVIAIKSSKDKASQVSLLDQLPDITSVTRGLNSKLPFITANMAVEETSLGSISNLEKLHDYSSFKAGAFTFIANNYPSNFNNCTNFFNTLDKISMKELTMQEKRILSGIFVSCTPSNIQSQQVQDFISTAIILKKELGVSFFTKLFGKQIVNKDTTLENYTSIASLLIELKEDININQLLDEHLLNLSDLKKALEEEQRRFLDKKYPEADLDIVISRFVTKEEFVQYPLSQDEMQQLKSDYIAIREYAAILKTKSMYSLSAMAMNIKNIISSGQNVSNTHASISPGSMEAQAKSNDCNSLRRDCLIKLLAIIQETVRHEFKIYPHNTQMLSVMALIYNPSKSQGRLAQIRTGEGKTTIIAMLAAYLVLIGKKVDIITVSDNLAKDNQEEFASFYSALNISSNFCTNDSVKEDFKAQVTYGTNYSFKFAVLRGDKTEFNEAIVDEADNFFIDAASNSARIAIQASKDKSWVYEPIFKYMNGKSLDTIKIVEIRAILMNYQNGKYARSANLLSDKAIKGWIISAHTAISKRKI